MLRSQTSVDVGIGPQDKEDWSVYGAALTETEVDILTGEFKILRADIFQDCGKVLNPFLDVGQIEGAFVMGVGLWTSEKLAIDQKNGHLLTNNTWEYKVPMAKNIPEDFRVTIMSELGNPFKYLGAKDIGELPLSLSCSVVFSLSDALQSARNDFGDRTYFSLKLPVRIKSVLKSTVTSTDQLLLY